MHIQEFGRSEVVGGGGEGFLIWSSGNQEYEEV